ncbi:MAG: DNA translocase FtsK [Planctomycetota bacterium]
MESEAFDKLVEVRKRATSLALGFVALFMFLSLVTFSSADLAETRWPAAESFGNVCGAIGAHLAHWLMTHFGYASYFAAALAVGFAVRCLMKRDRIDAWMGIVGGIVMLVSASAAAQLIGPGTAHMPGSGGIVGIAASDVLMRYFGSTGSWLVTVLLFTLGGLLMSADELALWVAKHSVARVRGWLEARRERLAPPPISKPPIKVSKPPIVTGKSGAAKAAATAKAAAAAEAPAASATAVAPAPPKTTPADTRAAEEEAEDETDERLPPIDRHTPRGPQSPIDKIAVVPSQVVGRDYELPPLSLLDELEPFDEKALEASIRANSTILERTLSEFGIGARVVGIERGPAVTRYEMALAAGIKVNKIVGLSDDIAMAVKASSVRVVAPIPGKSTVGVEVPNPIKEIVQMIEVMTCDEYQTQKDKFILPILLGKDASGTPILSDLVRMPHLLIAGATGSGKSVCLSSIILTIMMHHRPENVRLILVDPKMVDLGMFERIPHLLTPVVTDMKRAPYVLEWATKQMDERYDMLARVGVRHITQYNKLGEDGIRERLGDEYDEEEVPPHMPYIVIVVDELADMMMVAAKEVEIYITRLAQKSRAVGIHIVLATQRPSVDVITGLIKSNLPTRISFHTTSKVDSRTILDRNGAEKLLGCGDLLFVPPGTSDLVRVQGTYCSDREIKRVVRFVKDQGDPAYMMNVRQLGRDEEGDGTPEGEYGPDDMYDPACRVVLESRRGSVSLLQRKLEIGYTRAARLVDMMAVEGIVGGYKGSKAREVVMTLEEWEESRGIPPEERASARANEDDGASFTDTLADDDDEDDD